MKEKLDRATSAEGLKFLILQLVPYILHLETRIGLKLLTLMCKEGLTNTKGKILNVIQSIGSENKREKFYRENIENLFNNSIIGSGHNIFQFVLPLEKTLKAQDEKLVPTTLKMQKYEESSIILSK